MPIGMLNKTHEPIPFLVPSAIMLRKILSQRLSGKQAQPIAVKLPEVLVIPLLVELTDVDTPPVRC